MEHRSRTFKYASRNTLAFDQAMHDATVEQEITKERIADASEHVHTAIGCMKRDKDKRDITKHYGVEEIAGREVAVTDEHETEADVVEPTGQEKGDRIGHEVIRARLTELRGHRAALESPGNDRTIATIDAEAVRLRGMLP